MSEGVPAAIDAAASNVTASGGGGGGGGGGAVNARPVAVIKVAEDGVTVVPIFDMTRIAIAAFGVFLALRKALRR